MCAKESYCNTFCLVCSTIKAEKLDINVSECGLDKIEAFICLQKVSMSDLLASVVPP